MKKTLTLNKSEQLVSKKESGEAFTTSLVLADRFRKRHNTVLRKIHNLPKDKFHERNFALVKYVDSKGEQRSMYEMSRDGFSLLAMSFTGGEAYRWKIKFIDAFNKMEAHLRNVTKKGWLKEREGAALEYKQMSRTLQAVRDLAGKETKHYHYANEAKLVNWAMTGEFKKVDRESLSSDDLKTLTQLELYNSVLIGAGVDRDERKAKLTHRYQEMTAALLEKKAA